MANMPLCMQKAANMLVAHPAEKDLGLKAVAQLQGRWHLSARWLEPFCHQLPLRQSAGPGLLSSVAAVHRGHGCRRRQEKKLATIGVNLPRGRLPRMVRLALSDVRRGRTGWGVRTLLSSPEAYLKNFVLRRSYNPNSNSKELII